ncbi:hypothetical protein ACT3RP_13260 [Halomonas sp. AOP5-B2-8]
MDKVTGIYKICFSKVATRYCDILSNFLKKPAWPPPLLLIAACHALLLESSGSRYVGIIYLLAIAPHAQKAKREGA